MYWTNDVILGTINNVYHVNSLFVRVIFGGKVGFCLSQDCLIHGNTSNQTV